MERVRAFAAAIDIFLHKTKGARNLCPSILNPVLPLENPHRGSEALHRGGRRILLLKE